MSGIPDLKEYETWGSFDPATRFAIGWLDSEYFPKRPPSEEFLDALFAADDHVVRVLRGFHRCPFCPFREEAMYVMPTATRGSRTIGLGTGEFDILGENGKIYAAPTLICHYVEVHHYAPPEEFVRAVVRQYGKEGA